MVDRVWRREQYFFAANAASSGTKISPVCPRHRSAAPQSCPAATVPGQSSPRWAAIAPQWLNGFFGDFGQALTNCHPGIACETRKHRRPLFARAGIQRRLGSASSNTLEPEPTMKLSRTTIAAIGAALLALAAYGAHAQNWPQRPITYIVPFTPGGTTDVIGRAIAHGLGP